MLEELIVTVQASASQRRSSMLCTRVCCQDGTVSFQGDSDALISKGWVKLRWHNSFRESRDIKW